MAAVGGYRPVARIESRRSVAFFRSACRPLLITAEPYPEFLDEHSERHLPRYTGRSTQNSLRTAQGRQEPVDRDQHEAPFPQQRSRSWIPLYDTSCKPRRT